MVCATMLGADFGRHDCIRLSLSLLDRCFVGKQAVWSPAWLPDVLLLTGLLMIEFAILHRQLLVPTFLSTAARKLIQSNKVGC